MEPLEKRNRKRKEEPKRKKGRNICLALFPFSILLLSFARYIPGFSETIYITYIYRWLSQGLGMATGWLPFSLMEIEIILLLLASLYFLCRWLIGFITRKGKRLETLKNGFLNLAAFLSFIFFLYSITCGMNYYRTPFTEYSGLEIKEHSVKELQSLCFSLAEKANQLRDQLEEDEEGVVKFHFKNKQEMANEAKKAMDRLSEKYPVLGGIYPPPKKMIFSKIMSSMELTGIFWGFTMEANVNTDVLDFTIPPTMCHELSHLRGFMREEEANYIGYLACVNSDNKELNYSGVLFALSYASSQLYQTDAEAYWEVRKQYSDAIVRDQKADNAYWLPYQNTVVSTVSNQVNNTYLKANNQADGVKSYGRMVDLLLAEYLL